MKTSQEYVEALYETVDARVAEFSALLEAYTERQPTEVQEYLEELGLTDADEKVKNFVSNAIHTTLVLAVLADFVGGTPPMMVMLTGMSPVNIGEQMVSNATQAETNVDQFAEILVEVHSAVTGTPVERDENGTVDVRSYIHGRETFPGPSDLAQEVIDTFRSLSTTVAA